MCGNIHLLRMKGDHSSSWKRESVSWLDGLEKEISHARVTVFCGEDFNNYALYTDEHEQPHLVKQNGDSFTEILGLNLRKTDYRQVAVLENGNIVSADMGKECFVYRKNDSSLLTSFQSGWYESMCVQGNRIYITDPTDSSVQRYDAEEEKFKTTIEAGFDSSVRIAIQEDDVYVCCPKGIYRAKETGERFQKILDAGTYHFARDGIILMKFFVVGDVFYVVYGEDGGAIKKYAPAEGGEEAEKFLTVYSLENNAVILDMLSEFQNKYPDVEIVYETGEGADGSITVADRIRALNARILAGDGPDILLLDGLPAESYVEKGILSDLTPAIANVKGELLPAILSAYTVEDKIYMLPLRFTVPVFLTSGQNPDMYSTLEALVKYSEENMGVMQGGYPYSDFLEMLYYNYTPEIISEDDTVNKENIKVFLEQAKRLCESEQVSDTAQHMITYLEGYSNGDDFAYGEADIMLVNMSGGYELAHIPDMVKSRGGEIVGNGGMFFPNAVLGLNALSGKKEQAYLFLEFAISYEIQNRLVDFSGYQVCTKVLDEFAQKDLSYLMIAGEDGGDGFTYFTQEQSERMIQIAKGVYQPFTVDANIWKVLEEEAMGYLKGQKRLEESVDAIVSRIQLYLYEQ